VRRTKEKKLEDDLDFGAAMTAPEPPEPQTRTAKVAKTDFIEPISMPDGIDIRATALSLVPYEQHVKALVLAAREIQVTDEASRKQATEIGLTAKKLRLRVEKIEDSPAIQVALNFVKDARHLIKTLAGPLKTDVEQVCKGKLTAYSEQLILAQRRREAAARDEARVLQARLDAEAAQLRADAEAKVRAAQEELARQEAAGQVSETERAILEKTVEEETAAAESIVAPQVVVRTQEPDTVVRTEAGSSFTTSRWKPRLVDIGKVHLKYLVVDMKVVQRDVDGGMRTIDGFVVEEVLGTSLRG
jgi:hypothetical protein